jgi:small-conductance mechanosensitive channel
MFPKSLDLPIPLEQALYVLGTLASGLLGGLILKFVVFGILRASNRRADAPLFTKSLARRLNRPSTFFLPVLVLSFVLPLTPLTPKALEVLRRFVETTLIATFAWCLVAIVDVIEDLVRDHYEAPQGDNLRVRKLFTQLQFVKKLTISIILFLAIGLILMSFATVRRIGTGLLTSAGIASVIIGFAAQRSLSNLLAGFQIAFSQPIRLDDVLVVEGEWGRVEEITLTYVVVRIWDERRLVLPLNYFIEKPFQNWTRTTSQLIGAVYLHVDYTLPVEEMRAELKRLVEQEPLWDERVCVLQVTDTKERTMELRVLVSASDSGRTFDLRCIVREKLVAFIQQQYPDSLPKTRSLVSPSDQPFVSQGAVLGEA